MRSIAHECREDAVLSFLDKFSLIKLTISPPTFIQEDDLEFVNSTADDGNIEILLTFGLPPVDLIFLLCAVADVIGIHDLMSMEFSGQEMSLSKNFIIKVEKNCNDGFLEDVSTKHWNHKGEFIG